MAKHLYSAILFLILGLIAFVSCHADDWESVRDEELEQHRKALNNFDVEYCLQSLNRAIAEYEEHHHNYANKEQAGRLAELYKIATDRGSVDNLALLSTYAGHVIFCDEDIAEEIVKISQRVAGEIP